MVIDKVVTTDDGVLILRDAQAAIPTGTVCVGEVAVLASIASIVTQIGTEVTSDNAVERKIGEWFIARKMLLLPVLLLPVLARE